MSSPRVIILDIESSPNIVYTWGKYDQNVIEQIEGWQILSFAWKELQRGPVQCLARPDFRDRTDKAISKAIWKILNGADVVIGQNSDRFDMPKLRTKFVAHGLQPLQPPKQVDLKKIAKAHFSFFSNSLVDISNDLRTGGKFKHSGFELWKRCMQGYMRPGAIDLAAWNEMRRYNKKDVLLTERDYLKVRAWHPTHPNFALYSGEGDRVECPLCETTRVQRRGFHVMKARRAARFQCQNPKCGHWFSRALSKAERAAS